MSEPAVGDNLACLRCSSPMTNTGVHKFRVGGSTGGMKLLFGEWAELGEDMIPMESLVCPTCRYVELRMPTASS